MDVCLFLVAHPALESAQQGAIIGGAIGAASSLSSAAPGGCSAT
jgi:hypothetical protein